MTGDMWSSGHVRVGFVVPAVEGEATLLAGCLDNLLAVARQLPRIEVRIIVCWQSERREPPTSLTDDPRIQLLVLARIGVAAARNRGLDLIVGSVDAVMFVDVAVRPDALFLAAALPALSADPLVSSPATFAVETASKAAGTPVVRVGAAFVVFRGFIWSSLFRAEALSNLRFSEMIGPGTPSVHQSGEDARLLHALTMRMRLTTLPYLPHAPVRRLPRPDLAEKQRRYAHGQGYLVGQYLRHPTPGGRLYYFWRAALFLGHSVVLWAQGGASRALGRHRIAAFLAGVREQDTRVPPLSTGEGDVG